MNQNRNTGAETTTVSPALAKLPVSRRWSDDEKQELKRWLDSGWDWQFPGYSQAALHINSLFGNNRSASACRAMDYRLCNGSQHYITRNKPLAKHQQNTCKMPTKAKITIEIPNYLKEWIDKHDVGQNAIATLAIRNMYLQEKQVDENLLYLKIKDLIENKKLPF